ncbi:MAG: amidohydrolase [Alphaproteobacteria bacterium]|jgi:predicted amidohydrolase|nr:amidohydrolase [Alphaproteobacteria bacterium]
MKIAACAHHCDRVPDWGALRGKLDALVAECSADLVVLPEYAAMEAALAGNPDDPGEIGWRDRAADRAAGWVDLFRDLAARHGSHILAGSGPARVGNGVVNRSWLVAPSGAVEYQDKLILTPYERDRLAMTPGEELRLFDTALGRIGVLVCYDSEFPLLARRLAEGGANMILVPSCTDFPAGQTRVRQSARARAIENQCLVVQAPLVGRVASCGIVDESTGRAGLFCPPDHGLPSEGILAQGDTDSTRPVIAEVDPAAIAAPRQAGQVGNFAHWDEQERHDRGVKTVALA